MKKESNRKEEEINRETNSIVLVPQVVVEVTPKMLLGLEANVVDKLEIISSMFYRINNNNNKIMRLAKLTLLPLLYLQVAMEVLRILVSLIEINNNSRSIFRHMVIVVVVTL